MYVNIAELQRQIQVITFHSIKFCGMWLLIHALDTRFDHQVHVSPIVGINLIYIYIYIY